MQAWRYIFLEAVSDNSVALWYNSCTPRRRPGINSHSNRRFSLFVLFAYFSIFRSQKRLAIFPNQQRHNFCFCSLKWPCTIFFKMFRKYCRSAVVAFVSTRAEYYSAARGLVFTMNSQSHLKLLSLLSTNDATDSKITASQAKYQSLADLSVARSVVTVTPSAGRDLSARARAISLKRRALEKN